MMPRRSYTDMKVRINWHDTDNEWNNFIMLWHDNFYMLLRGIEQVHYGHICQHDGIPFLVKWNAVKTIKPLK